MDILTLLVYLIAIYIVYQVILKILRIPQISDLGSRYILVTGCDTGFGNAVTKKLDGLGCHVIATCLTENGETELRKACSRRVHTIHLDVSDSESVKKALEEVKSILPAGQGLWGLLNNAGIAGRLGAANWYVVEDYKHCLSVNTFGLIDVTMNFLPLIKKTKGRIVNTASMAGRLSSCGLVPYSVSKFGVEAFSDGLRRDLAAFGVSVSIIEPSFFKTNITDMNKNLASLKESFDKLPDEIKEIYGVDFVENWRKGREEKLIETLIDNATDISPVVDAYTHALLGRFPSARYTVGSGVYIGLLLQALPEWIGDRILHFLFGVKVNP